MLYTYWTLLNAALISIFQKIGGVKLESSKVLGFFSPF